MRFVDWFFCQADAPRMKRAKQSSPPQPNGHEVWEVALKKTEHRRRSRTEGTRMKRVLGESNVTLGGRLKAWFATLLHLYVKL